MTRKTLGTARLLALALAAAAAVLLTGCALLGGSTVSASDGNNLFHFKVPAKWLVTNEAGVLSVYADKRLPVEGEDPSALSLIVMSSTDASTAPVADVLNYLIDARAVQRGWTDVTKGESQPVTVGGREGISMTVRATSAESKQFESRYLFVRTAGNEVFVAAIAPTGKPIESYDRDIERIIGQWYWHFGDSESESQATTDTSRQP